MQPLLADEVTDMVLRASRALVAVAARSLDAVDNGITLPQYRALVVLCGRGPITMGVLAEKLGCSGSTATRLCDRLVDKALVERAQRQANRREVEVRVTATGKALVGAVTRRRRAEISRIVEAIPAKERAALVRALGTFAEAAGEVPDQAWATGWDL